MPVRGIDAAVTLVNAAGVNVSGAAAAVLDDTFNPTVTPVSTFGAIVLASTQGGAGEVSRVLAHTSASDARANTINGLVVQSRLYAHNHNTPGSGTDDLIRTANAAAGNTGTGLLGAGNLLHDGTNWQKLKGNADGSLPVGGFAPAAPTCTFTRGANQTAYTIGDEVGTASTAPTTIPVGRLNGGSGIIQGANLLYSSYPATVPQLVVVIFSATATLAGDNAQLNLSDADAVKIVCLIPLTASQSTQYSAGAAVAAGGVWLSGAPTRPAPHFVLGASEQTLYACLITLNAFTPIANSETLQLWLDVELN